MYIYIYVSQNNSVYADNTAIKHIVRKKNIENTENETRICSKMRCTKAKINNHKSICIPLLTTPPDPKTFQISHFCQSNAFVQFMANTLPNHHNTWGADPFEQFDPPILLPIQKPSNYPMSANQMPSSNSWPTPCQIIITPGVLILSNNLIHLLYATTYLFTLVN